MQNKAEIYIREIETILANSPQAGMEKIQEMISKPDSLNLVPIIFQITLNPYLIFGAVKILENHIKNNWATLTEEDKANFRSFVTKSLATCPEIQGLKSRLNSVLVKIAIRSYPDEWPDFLTSAINDCQYEQFQYFLEEMNELPVDILPPQKKTEIVQELVTNAQFFLQSLIIGYQYSDLALERYVHYIKWNMVNQVDFSSVLGEDPLEFGPLCSILQIEGVPEDFIQVAFNVLANLEMHDPVIFKRIIPILQQHITILEKEQNLQNLTNVHLKLFDLDFVDLLYYWEPFVVTIYAQFQKSGGITPRFNIHYQILCKIRDYVIFHMIQPPDFIIPEVIPSTNDQQQRENYSDMRSILISFIGMTPNEVNESFELGLHFLNENYDQDNFLSIIWTLGCISGATKSHLEAAFVVESMKFVLDVLRKPNINKPVVASSFLFLASSYARAQKLTPRFIEVTIQLSIQALDSPKTQKIAANTLLSIAKYSTSMISDVPAGLIEIVGGAIKDISPETYATVTEACGRIYQAKSKVDPVLKVIVNRFMNASSADEVNFNVAREQITVMNGFVGLSRVNSSAVERVVVKYRQTLIQITQTFGGNVIQIFTESGPDSIYRDDVRYMMTYIQSEAVLFKELAFRDCGDILTLYGQFPNELKFSEALQLTEALFKTQLEPHVVSGLHETVVKPTIELITNNPGEFPDHEELLPRVLNAMAQSYFEIVDPDDLQVLINDLMDNSRPTVLNAIKALDTCIEKADMKLIEDLRDGFFRNFLGIVMYRLLFVITDPNHFYCYSQLLRFLYKLFDFVGSGKVRCQLFPDVENVQGMSMYLSTLTVQDFPLVTIQEMMALLPLLFQVKMPMEMFEELIAQYISRARQTTPGETLNILRLQQFKNSISDFIYI